MAPFLMGIITQYQVDYIFSLWRKDLSPEEKNVF
jgi:hypothetical protein